ncbi:hypothetical protein [Kribbella sp. NPDC004875]|uniref:hypothetical protein n=1 Tax=Kribbella sp. NPDC004875 TaxID=3364107 RepID=UPI00367C8AF4
MKLRAAVAAVAAVPLALGLAACNHEAKPTGYRPSAPAEVTDSRPSTAAPLKQAPAAHLNRISFVPAMNTALTKQKSWRITGTMSANGSTVMTMDGVQTAKPLAMSVRATGAALGGQQAHILLVGKTLYVSAPGFSPTGKYKKVGGADARQVRSLVDSGDPTKLFSSFSSALVGVRYTGTQTIAGKKLERYVVTVDTAKALKATGTAVPAGAPETVSYELLLDAQHLVRQVRFEDLGISMKLSMTDYNKPVHITAPPASKITK